MRKSLSASALLLVLCCPAFAGDMLTPPAPPPPTAPYVCAPGSDEEVSDPIPVDGSIAQDISVTQLAVSIFESLLAVI
jgi:hypothetical protein